MSAAGGRVGAAGGSAMWAGNLKWLYAGRAARSLATAFLTVIFPLYLAKEGMGAAEVGLILSLSGVIGMLLVVAVGLGADLLGRRRALLALSVLTVVGGLLLAWLPLGPLVAIIASGLGGIGRGGGAGSGGAWGPVFPAEQPLLAAAAPKTNRTHAFGVISFVGVIAGAVGSLVAGVPQILVGHGVPMVVGYRILFALAAALGVAMTALTLPIREPPVVREAAADAPPTPISVRQLIGRLSVTNGLNGFGIGFLGPLFTYWLYLRFGVGPAELGVLYAIVNLAAALPYLTSSALVRRLGAVRTVVWTRLAGVAALVAMPFLPSFTLVGVAYTLRMILNSLGMPARQSFTMAVSDERYRSRVAAFGSLPSQITSLVSPAVAGVVMESWLSFPLFGAAFFIAANAVAYHYAFHEVAVPGEAPRPATGGEGGVSQPAGTYDV